MNLFNHAQILSLPATSIAASIAVSLAITGAASLAVLHTSACSNDSSDQVDAGQGGSGSSDSEDGTGGTVIPCDDSAEMDSADSNPSKPVELDGLYALSVRLSFTFSSQPGGAVTVCPVDQTNEGSFLGFAKIEHKPNQTTAHISAVACSLELPVVSAIVGECKPAATNIVSAGLEFPPKLIDAAPTVDTAQASLLLTSTQRDSAVSAHGLKFSLGTNEGMATAPKWKPDEAGCGNNDNASGRSPNCEEKCVTDCSKMIDHDNDGWPGVTVHVCGYTEDDKRSSIPCNAVTPNEAGTTIQGRSFMNLQVDPLTLNGTAKSSCELVGNIDADFTYNVVGADLYLANAQISVASAIKSLPQYAVNSSESRFRLVRIDGLHGSWNWNPSWSELQASCRRIIANQHELH